MKIRYIFASLALIAFCSCNSWFDVNPKTEVKNDELFSSASGFRSALIGVYTSMAQRELYGGELTMGTVDVMGQYYDLLNNTHTYYYAEHYDYSQETMKNTFATIWQEMYKNIVNCNNILDNLSTHGNVLSDRDRNIIKGECLGLRAYLHFDLLRLFAPSVAANPTGAGIPYNTEVSRAPLPQLTTQEDLELIDKDCDEAIACLDKVDPWSTDYENASLSQEDTKFLSHREERMNWRAVKALKARVALWKGDKATALKIASELISIPGLQLYDDIFDLYSDKLGEYSEYYFSPSASSGLEVTQSRLDDIYESAKYGSNKDRRAQLYVSTYPDSYKMYVSRWRTNSVNPPVDMTLINAVELYYIVAECTSSTATSLQMLNTVRNSYGFTSENNLREGQVDVDNEIMKEYRKSFIGEGQFFYYLKRRNIENIPDAPEKVSYKTAYVVPLPEKEMEYGNLIK